MDKAIDQISGRINEPIVLTEENAWRTIYNSRHWRNNDEPEYIEFNMITRQERPC